jgi:hypothetical protein
MILCGEKVTTLIFRYDMVLLKGDTFLIMTVEEITF